MTPDDRVRAWVHNDNVVSARDRFISASRVQRLIFTVVPRLTATSETLSSERWSMVAQYFCSCAVRSLHSADGYGSLGGAGISTLSVAIVVIAIASSAIVFSILRIAVRRAAKKAPPNR